MAQALRLVANNSDLPQVNSAKGNDFQGVPNMFTVTHRGVFQGMVIENQMVTLGQRPGWERWVKLDDGNKPLVYKDNLVHRGEFVPRQGAKHVYHLLVADPKPFPSAIYALIGTAVRGVVQTKYPHGVIPISGATQIERGDFEYRDQVNAKEEIWALEEGGTVGVIFADGQVRVLRCQKSGSGCKERLGLVLENDPSFTARMVKEHEEKRAAAAKQAEEERIAREAEKAKRDAEIEASLNAQVEFQAVSRALVLAEGFPKQLSREEIEAFGLTNTVPLASEVFHGTICDWLLAYFEEYIDEIQGGRYSKTQVYYLHTLAGLADKARMAIEVSDFIRDLHLRVPVPESVLDKLAPPSPTVVNHSPERAKRETRRAELRAKRLEKAPAKGPSGSKTNLGAAARARREAEAKGKK